MTAQVSTLHTPTEAAPLSMAAKRESWQDGYSHALLGMGYFGAQARSDQHYGDGYAAGEAWLLKHGMAN